jgi:hypothetical protein
MRNPGEGTTVVQSKTVARSYDMSEHVEKFQGVIVSVTPDGRAAFVRLNTPIHSVEFAVISPDTRGHIELMNGRGHFRINDHVEGSGKLGPSAIKVESVKLLSVA